MLGKQASTHVLGAQMRGAFRMVQFDERLTFDKTTSTLSLSEKPSPKVYYLGGGRWGTPKMVLHIRIQQVVCQMF